MSLLFEVNGKAVVPTTEVRLIEPFKTIWERDSKESKEDALRDFAFIEFMVSKKKTNPYAGYSEEERLAKLSEIYYGKSGIELDPLVEQGMAKTVEFQTTASATYSYLTSLLNIADRIKHYFNTVDIDERDDKGKPIHTISNITRAIGDIDKVLQTLHTAQEKVEQELYETTKTRGNKTIGAYEQ